MRAGKLRHRIVIQQKGTAQDSTGQQVPNWTTFATLWADKVELSGRQFFAAGAELNEVKSAFSLRYLPGVLAAMRVSLDGVYYDIIAATDPDGRKRDTLLACTSGTSAG